MNLISPTGQLQKLFSQGLGGIALWLYLFKHDKLFSPNIAMPMMNTLYWYDHDLDLRNNEDFCVRSTRKARIRPCHYDCMPP